VIVSAAGVLAVGKHGKFPRRSLRLSVAARTATAETGRRRGQMPERTIELSSYHAMLRARALPLLPKSVLTTFPRASGYAARVAAGEIAPRPVDLARGAWSPNIEALQQNAGSAQSRQTRTERLHRFCYAPSMMMKSASAYFCRIALAD
jgi:hypothetical protein